MSIYQILMACGVACIIGAALVDLFVLTLELHTQDKEDDAEAERWTKHD